MNKTKLLIVDDEEDMRSGIKRMLAREFKDFDIITAEDGEHALRVLSSTSVDIALFDIKMPGMSGLELLNRISGSNPWVTVIMMTGFGTIELAVEAIKLGAYDFISKPFDREILYRTIHKGLERNKLLKENFTLRQQVNSNEHKTEFIGTSSAMNRFQADLQTVARTHYTTLVRGESGTGKELAARAIHSLSPRKDKPLIMVNCPAIPENLLESELFGHVKGAFTGASHDQPGLFSEADGGTICLDEVGDIPISIQSKLLRVLQEQEIKPLGATKTHKVDVRVIALTNLNLEEMISLRQFREDLFYRLNVVTLETPSLKDIVDDIPLLVHHFSMKVSKELDEDPKTFSIQACQFLAKKTWPGNIRELQNCVRRVVMFSKNNSIEAEDIHFIEDKASTHVNDTAQATCLIYGDDSKILPYKEAKESAIDNFTHIYLEALLSSTDGNISQAAQLSEISRAALQKIMKRHQIKGDKYRDE